MSLILAVNCPFKEQFHRYLSPMCPPLPPLRLFLLFGQHPITNMGKCSGVIMLAQTHGALSSENMLCAFCAQYSVRAQSQGDDVSPYSTYSSLTPQFLGRNISILQFN